jgi:hypothetical protein
MVETSVDLCHLDVLVDVVHGLALALILVDTLGRSQLAASKKVYCCIAFKGLIYNIFSSI